MCKVIGYASARRNLTLCFKVVQHASDGSDKFVSQWPPTGRSAVQTSFEISEEDRERLGHLHYRRGASLTYELMVPTITGSMLGICTFDSLKAAMEQPAGSSILICIGENPMFQISTGDAGHMGVTFGKVTPIMVYEPPSIPST